MNLLPEENKILFKKHYLKRLSVVFAVLIFSAAAIGIIILMPMYSLVLSYKKDLSRGLAVYFKKNAELADSAAALEIKKLNSRLDFVEKTSKVKRLNSVFKNILDKKNMGVKITYFSYEKGKEPNGEDKVYLSGKSKTRDEFLVFENRLKKELGDGKVVSPVSNLINEKDFDFSLVLNIKNEK